MSDETLFHQALDHPPHEREAFLRQACGGDNTLRQRVETLLQAHDQPAGFMAQPCVPPIPPLGAAELEFLAPSTRPGSLGRMGHYEILEVVGSGGFGIVFKAFDEQLQRVVAIKTLSRTLAASATARKRFEREAIAAAAVNHENVVDIHAVDGSGPIPYLVMEYVAGASLERQLKQEGPLGIKEVLRIGLQIAEGLAAAHKQGLVHRDVKPANILLENGVQRVKITDFGLARAVDDATLTQTGLIAGTPSFMSPEQARGETVDHRSDLFSLGSVLYVMCTGRSPFRGSHAMAVLKRVCEEQPTPIRDIHAEIPDWLTAIVEKLHAKEPAERFQSAVEVAENLAQHLAQVQQSSRPDFRLQIADPRLPEKVSSPSKIRNPQSTIGRRRWLTVATAAVLCLAASLGLTEATGTTQLAATVIRIFTPEGTLVVEASDPGVKVTIEGDGGVVITAKDGQQVRLPAGSSYKLRAVKDGRPVPLDRDLVTITQGQKQVVKVRLEAVSPPGPPEQSSQSESPPVGEIRRFVGHTQHVWTVAFHPDGRRALSGGWDNTIRLWDLKTGKELRRFEGHARAINSVVFSADGRFALSGSADRTVRLWDVETGKELRRFEGHTENVWCVVFSPDDRRVLSAGASFENKDSTIRLWDVESGQELDCWEGHEFSVMGVAFSPDGRRALSCDRGSGSLRLWDVESGQELARLHGHVGGVEGVVFLPDGRRALSVGGQGDPTLRLWDVENGTELRRFGGHTAWTSSVAVSPDGRRALSAGHDRTIRLWDVETGKELYCLWGHTACVQSVRFSHDGRRALTGSQDKDNTMRLWQLPPPNKELRIKKP